MKTALDVAGIVLLTGGIIPLSVLDTAALFTNGDWKPIGPRAEAQSARSQRWVALHWKPVVAMSSLAVVAGLVPVVLAG